MSAPAQADDRENLEFKWVKKGGFGGKKKEVQFYESFIYDGVYYELFDCVYLCKDGEPEPYIGKIIKIWEIIQIKIRKVKILWFFRPCEIVNWLGDEEPSEDELFLACGEGSGVSNVNPLEAISGKCNVVCISKDNRNPQPSEEDLQSADFKFQRMFDVQTHTIIDKIVRVCLVEVESIFNKKHKSDSIRDPKSYSHDVPGHSVARDVIEKEEEKGENIAGKLLVSEVRDETKVKSLKNSDELDIRPLKKVKVDGSTQLVEDEKVNVLDKRCVNSDKNNVSLVEADGNVNKVLSQLEDEKKVKTTKVMVKPKNVFEDGNMKKSANDFENGKKVNPKKNIDADKVKSKEIDDEKKGKSLEDDNVNKVLSQLEDEKKVKATKVMVKPKNVFEDGNMKKSANDFENGKKVNPQKSIDADKVKSKEIDDEKKGKYLEVVRDGKKEKLKKVFVDEKTTKSSKGIEYGTKANLIEMTNGLDVMAFNKSSAYETSPLGVGKRDMLFSHYVGDVMNKKSKNDIDELEIRPWKKARVESSTEQLVEKEGNEDLKLPTHSYVGEKLANKGEDRIDEVLVNGNEERTKVNASSANVSIGQDQTSTIKNSKGGGSVKKGNVKQVVKDNSITKLVKTSSQVEALLSKKIKLDKQTSNLSSGKLVKAHSSKQPNMEGKLANQIIYVTRRPDAGMSKYFKEIPWEQSMKDAHKHGLLVLLENLDPTYTSAEVEDIIWHGFKESCISARMLERTAIASPHSGQAFVIFKTKEAAEKVVRRLEENCLLLPNGRVLVGSLGTPCFPVKGSTIVGHFALDKQRVQMHREMKEAVSTSHCSQGNTIEYEMAMEWFLLLERFQTCWHKLYQVQGEEWKRASTKLSSK